MYKVRVNEFGGVDGQWNVGPPVRETFCDLAERAKRDGLLDIGGTRQRVSCPSYCPEVVNVESPRMLDEASEFVESHCPASAISGKSWLV